MAQNPAVMNRLALVLSHSDQRVRPQTAGSRILPQWNL